MHLRPCYECPDDEDSEKDADDADEVVLAASQTDDSDHEEEQTDRAYDEPLDGIDRRTFLRFGRLDEVF